MGLHTGHAVASHASLESSQEKRRTENKEHVLRVVVNGTIAGRAHVRRHVEGEVGKGA
jgi:hypothetical protein